MPVWNYLYLKIFSNCDTLEKTSRMSTIIALIFIGAITLYIFSQKKPHKNYPPGPWGFPIFGHLPFLRKDMFGQMLRWKEKYGSVYSVVFGSYRAVVINDYKLIKEAMNEPIFTGRPRLPPVCVRSGGEPKGIAFTDGDEWIEKRRFTLKTLRNFGFGKKSMEGIVQEEVLELIEHFKKEVGQPVSTINRFNAAILNALWQIISGERFKQDDPELLSILKLVNSAFPEANSMATLSSLIPIIGKLFPNLGFNNMMSQAAKIVNYVKTFSERHKQTHIPNQPRGFLDVYFDEIDASTPGSGFYGAEGKHAMLFVLVDLFSAGAETTSTTLTNIFLYLALNESCQRKMQNEIDSVVGLSLPSLSDRPKMPYVEAVINEVLRLCPLISVMHRATRDMDFHGFYIPKDTILIPNMYAAHYDKDYWGDPHVFRPERYLSPDGKTYIKQDANLAFMPGKRVCPAETLARDELFLFTSSLFQTFSVHLDPTKPKPSTELVIKTVISPKPHKILLKLRK